ncbi:antitoxin VbhA family protein [Nocardia sp. NPDC051321]|uniref:antitoxin VbhA family protein n=1 Tax=Nocardia sp. NPDC051321 TaxID=3364323 RepID=UPI00378E33E8
MKLGSNCLVCWSGFVVMIARRRVWVLTVRQRRWMVFEEFTAERARSVVQAAASVEAEGLSPSAEADVILERWARGEIGTAQMRELVRRLHGVE